MIFKNPILHLLTLFSLCMSSLLSATPTLKIVTTVPELAWLAKEIGGDRVEVEALLNGTENPHYLDAVPSFVMKVARADIFCSVGLDLEVGYLGAILQRSANQSVQPGGDGYCEAGKTIDALDKPKGKVDRSQGDVHASGNPHYWLSPKAMIQAAEVIKEVMKKKRPEHAKDFERSYALLKRQLEDIDSKVRTRLASLKPDTLMIAEYHNEFSYFLSNYGFQRWGSIEEVPGVMPSPSRLRSVADQTKADKVAVYLASPYSPKNLLEQVAKQSQIPIVYIPTMIQKSGPCSTYAGLQMAIAESLITKSDVCKIP